MYPQFLGLRVLGPRGRRMGISQVHVCLWSMEKYLGTWAQYHGSTLAFELEAKRDVRTTTRAWAVFLVSRAEAQQPRRADIALCSRQAPNLDGQQWKAQGRRCPGQHGWRGAKVQPASRFPVLHLMLPSVFLLHFNTFNTVFPLQQPS